jgi:hypothetical protein
MILCRLRLLAIRRREVSALGCPFHDADDLITAVQETLEGFERYVNQGCWEISDDTSTMD